MNSPYTISNSDLTVIYESENVNNSATFYKLRPDNDIGFLLTFGNELTIIVERDMAFLESVTILLPTEAVFPSGGLSYTIDVWISSDLVGKTSRSAISLDLGRRLPAFSRSFDVLFTSEIEYLSAYLLLGF